MEVSASRLTSLRPKTFEPFLDHHLKRTLVFGLKNDFDIASSYHLNALCFSAEEILEFIMAEDNKLEELNLTPEQIADFKEAFSLFDHDENGSISSVELVKYSERLAKTPVTMNCET